MGAVWISYAMIDMSTRISPLVNDLDEQSAIDSLNRNEAGEPLPQAMFPSTVREAEPGVLGGRLPDLFWANAFWVVSAAAAESLRSCDLGAGALYPLKLLRHDGAPLTGETFCLNFGNVKGVFLPDQSTADQNPFNAAVWYPCVGLKDDDIAVSADALSGPDIWASPPLKKAFFVSERLADALRAAGVAKFFHLRRCRVI